MAGKIADFEDLIVSQREAGSTWTAIAEMLKERGLVRSRQNVHDFYAARAKRLLKIQAKAAVSGIGTSSQVAAEQQSASAAELQAAKLANEMILQQLREQGELIRALADQVKALSAGGVLVSTAPVAAAAVVANRTEHTKELATTSTTEATTRPTPTNATASPYFIDLTGTTNAKKLAAHRDAIHSEKQVETPKG